jgi:hypothetical protein
MFSQLLRLRVTLLYQFHLMLGRLDALLRFLLKGVQLCSDFFTGLRYFKREETRPVSAIGGVGTIINNRYG